MIGIDLVKSARIEHFIERFGDKGLARFLCEDEIKIIKSPQSAAGFWAIKEAFAKALGTGIGASCSFHDIRVYKTPLGAPKIALSKKIMQKFHIQDVALSITHDGEYVIGVVSIQTLSPTDKIKQF